MDPFDRNPDVLWGVAEEVAPNIRRITAENPSAYTFTGTRSYLVGRGDVALIDPGPDDPAHIAAILGALRGAERISHILVTHSHLDHSGAAPAIARATGAEVLAFGPHGSGMSPTMRALLESGAALGGGEGSDRDFLPDRELADGDTVEGDGWRLVALHTPGHL
ncbi:MAG TPA: MBL fold metallo-hydrolase, partial [Paracoccaceae bacterium]|nr:MBL fold metallo-hydrolase [Paracoccaceae bacterium]